MSETKQKSRRQMVEEARNSALQGNWEEAVDLNRAILDRYPRDADAYNRLGRALLAIKHFSSAYDAYSGAMKIDPANMIARRNLQRLELLRRKYGADDRELTEADLSTTIPKTNVFIEEVGKTWVDELVNPAPHEELADISSGEQLQLVVEGERLVVVRESGQRLGEIEAKTAERLMELLAGGNRYEVYALGRSSSSLRIILREVYRDPRLANRVSFPRQISYTRAYLRDRDQLRQRDESDFLFSDEDEEDSEDDDSSSHSSEDEVSGDTDTDAFEEDIVVAEEEPGI